MKLYLLLILISALLFSCSTVTSDSLSRKSYYPVGGWRQTYPEEFGIKREEIDKLVDYVKRKNIELHSISIIKEGYMIYEESLYEYDPNSLHDIASVTKSVISLLIGIAIDKGFIHSVDDRVVSYIPELDNLEDVTIGELLSMSAGLNGDLYSMILSGDWLGYLREVSINKSIRGRFNYSNINYQILAIIIARATSYSVEEFAGNYLLNPIGIKEWEWKENEDGYNHGWGDLRLSVSDMGKIAYLVTSRGMWNGAPIVPEEWILKSLSIQTSGGVNPFFKYDYGFGWFIPKGIKSNYFAAHGRGGQSIYIFPDSDSIIITTGNYHLKTLMFKLPDIVNSSEKIVSTIPPVTGSWIMEANDLGIESFSFEREDNQSYQLSIISGLISLDTYININGSTNTTYSEELGNVRSRFRILPDGKLEIEVNMIEGINSLKITLTPMDMDRVEVKIYEKNLVPRELSLIGYKK